MAEPAGPLAAQRDIGTADGMAPPAHAAGQTLHFVLNGAAGSQDDAPLLDALDQVLGSAGRRFELHRAPSPAELAATARAAAERAGPGGTVVSVGGDGTLNTVASAALKAGAALGLVPRGTFNYFARTHGIPLDEPSAVRLLLEGRPQPVQVGRVNDRIFLVNASLGMYPDLLEDRESFKKRFGRTRLVALGAALHSLLGAHRRLALHIEGDVQPPRDLKVSTLFVGNNRLQLERLGLPEAPRTGNSVLTALVLRKVRPGELLWLAVRGALGQLGEARDVGHFAFRRLTVRPRGALGSRPARPLKMALDGEITHLPPPIVFSVDGRPLRLIKPVDAKPMP